MSRPTVSARGGFMPLSRLSDKRARVAAISSIMGLTLPPTADSFGALGGVREPVVGAVDRSGCGRPDDHGKRPRQIPGRTCDAAPWTMGAGHGERSAQLRDSYGIGRVFAGPATFRPARQLEADV